MFKRSEDSGAGHGGLNSILGDSSTMKGSMQIEGSVRIDGEFEGSVTAAEAIFVGRTGLARADLAAREILVSGRVRGKLTASERVELQEGAHVEGDIFAPSFMIADGVFFNGTCNMKEEPSGHALPQRHVPATGEDGRADGADAAGGQSKIKMVKGS